MNIFIIRFKFFNYYINMIEKIEKFINSNEKMKFQNTEILNILIIKEKLKNTFYKDLNNFQ